MKTPATPSADKRHFYNRASAALDAAHKACFQHPDRGPVGMSHGPFSGVNEALGIVSELEADVHQLRAALRTALDHIDHMAAWIGAQHPGYSFESLGEDMQGMRDLCRYPATRRKAGSHD